MTLHYRIIVALLCFLSGGFASAQDTVRSGYNFVKYETPCTDDNGKPFNPSDLSNQVYEVKRFKSKLQVTLTIREIGLDGKRMCWTLSFKAELKMKQKLLS
jgi:hypothetical protein